jgi:hypothetical protein
MAVKKGLTPMFTSSEINSDIDEFVQEKKENAVKALQYAGEAFVNYARNLRTYKDRTGNLRSSISYVVAVDSNIVEENVQGSSEVGKQKGEEFAKRLAQGEGTVLIGVAGMEYAREVESRGLDVITGASKEGEKVLANVISDI